MAPLLSARLLGEFGDNPEPYVIAKVRKNYAAISPIMRGYYDRPNDRGFDASGSSWTGVGILLGMPQDRCHTS